MPVLVLSSRYSADTQALWRAAIARGWGVERVPGWSPPASLRGSEVALYGETFFCRALADALELELLDPPFDWLARLPEQYRRRAVRFGTLAEAQGELAPAFIKPADDKWFRASVYPSGAALLVTEGMEPGDPVLVAEPVEWESEYRLFVAEGRVHAASVYLREGELAQAEDGSWPAGADEVREAAAFGETVLADPDVELPPAVVMDVGVIRGRGWAVVEANPAWGSGIYGCDADRVLEVLAGATRRRGAKGGGRR